MNDNFLDDDPIISMLIDNIAMGVRMDKLEYTKDQAQIFTILVNNKTIDF